MEGGGGRGTGLPLTQLVEGPHDVAELELVEVVLAVILHPHALHVPGHVAKAQAAQWRYGFLPGHLVAGGKQRRGSEGRSPQPQLCLPFLHLPAKELKAPAHRD